MRLKGRWYLFGMLVWVTNFNKFMEYNLSFFDFWWIDVSTTRLVPVVC